jgi:hypothetical protein
MINHEKLCSFYLSKSTKISRRHWEQISNQTVDLFLANTYVWLRSDALRMIQESICWRNSLLEKRPLPCAISFPGAFYQAHGKGHSLLCA